MLTKCKENDRKTGKRKWGIQDRFLWIKISANNVFLYLTEFFCRSSWFRVMTSRQRGSGPTESPAITLRLLGSDPGFCSNTPSYWRSASAGTPLGSWWCNTYQPSGSGQRQRSPLEETKTENNVCVFMKTRQNDSRDAGPPGRPRSLFLSW